MKQGKSLRTGLLSAALVLLAPVSDAANASELTTIRVIEPPRQYRSGPPVHGTVTVTYEPSMTRIKTELCPSFRLSVGYLLGCVNIQTGRGCAITLWSGLHRAPTLRNAVEQHERAHCRGWSADHAGGITRIHNVGRGFFAGAIEPQAPEAQ